jgi:anoctamin-7
MWNKYQPLDAIRNYFGEQIAIYFAWLGFYTGWLIPVSVIGVLVFIYGLLTVQIDAVSDQVCRSRGKYRMCPLCEENLGCSYWDLSDICILQNYFPYIFHFKTVSIFLGTYSKLAYLFDHPGTVAFAVFVSFWGK